MPVSISGAQLASQHEVSELLRRHLEDRHRLALRAYVSDIMPDGTECFGYFEQLNSALRSGANFLPFQDKITSDLDDAFRVFALSEPISLYRGIGLTPADTKNLRAHGLENAAYSSCSTEFYVAERFARAAAAQFGTAVVLEIHLDVGQSLLPRESNDMEFEVLLPRPSSLQPINGGELNSEIWTIPVRLAAPV